MFQFTGFPPHNLWIQLWVTAHYHCGVSPFGYLRIKVRLQLPAAFRSWPRPSSASGAKAFTLCSFLLDLSNSACIVVTHYPASTSCTFPYSSVSAGSVFLVCSLLCSCQGAVLRFPSKLHSMFPMKEILQASLPVDLEVPACSPCCSP